MEAARLGHVPGTKEYYLIPRGNKELDSRSTPTSVASAKACATRGSGHRRLSGNHFRIHRAGAVQSVIVELVKSKDRLHLQSRPS